MKGQAKGLRPVPSLPQGHDHGKEGWGEETLEGKTLQGKTLEYLHALQGQEVTQAFNQLVQSRCTQLAATRVQNPSVLFSFFQTYLFLAVLGLGCCAQASSSCGSGSYSLLAGFSLQRPLSLRCTGSKACGPHQLQCVGLAALRHVGSSWTREDPMSPALAGELSATGPPGEPRNPGTVVFSLSQNPRLTFIALKMHFKVSLLLANHLI